MHRMTFRSPRGMALLTAMALLAACAGAPKVKVDQDRKANFASYQTFAYVTTPVAEEAKPSAMALSDQRARGTLTTVLQDKGYALDEARPDVRVSYVFNVYERPKQTGMRIGLGAGGGSGNVGGGVGVSLPIGKRNETVAAMTVNVIEAARNEQVWFGSSELVLQGNVATDADVKTLTETILAKYPARVR